MPTINNNVHYVKFMRGSIQAWETLKTTPELISDDTLYFIYASTANTKEGKLYLGQKLISGVGGNGSYTGDTINISDIGDVYIDDSILSDSQILVYNETNDQWENTSLSTIIDTAVGEFTGATSSTNGAKGLVPAPQAGDQLKFLRGDKRWVTIDIPTFDSDVFQSKIGAPLTITLAGFENAPIGTIPVKTDAGIQWTTSSIGSLRREIISLENLNSSVNAGTADENTIFMVPNNSQADSSNRFDEYMVIQGHIERLGIFGEVNLDGYVTTQVFQSTINNLQNILVDHVDNDTQEIVPGLISRVSFIENNYVTKSQIGDLSTLQLSTGNTTLVEEVNTINEELTELTERLQWQELNE